MHVAVRVNIQEKQKDAGHPGGYLLTDGQQKEGIETGDSSTTEQYLKRTAEGHLNQASNLKSS